MKNKTNPGLKIICLNRKASFNYFFEDLYEAGLILKGSEIKSVRNGKVNIAEAYAIERDGELGMAAGFVKWMMWSDEEFYIIQEPDIVTIAPMSTEAIMMYKMWWRKESGKNGEDPDPGVPMNENMGLVGKVSEMRKKLEDQWKKKDSK